MALERIDVVCTGGTYDDPENGPTPRHPRQKLGRLWIHCGAHVGSFHEEERVRRCPQCERHVPVARPLPTARGGRGEGTTVDPAVPATYVEGGVWQRILVWAQREHPDRRVVVVDISDRAYPW